MLVESSLHNIFTIETFPQSCKVWSWSRSRKRVKSFSDLSLKSVEVKNQNVFDIVQCQNRMFPFKSYYYFQSVITFMIENIIHNLFKVKISSNNKWQWHLFICNQNLQEKMEKLVKKTMFSIWFFFPIYNAYCKFLQDVPNQFSNMCFWVIFFHSFAVTCFSSR